MIVTKLHFSPSLSFSLSAVAAAAVPLRSAARCLLASGGAHMIGQRQSSPLHPLLACGRPLPGSSWVAVSWLSCCSPPVTLTRLQRGAPRPVLSVAASPA